MNDRISIMKLKWESEFFNKSIYKLQYKEGVEIEEFDLEADLIVVESENKFDRDILGYKSSYKEQKILYFKEILMGKFSLNEEIYDNDLTPLNPESFYHLALQSGEYSRFHLDDNFSEQDFIRLYHTWIDNTVNKSLDDKIFYTLNKDNVTSFLTLSYNEGDPKIGLIAVDSITRGKGLGKALIYHVEKHLSDKGYNQLSIPTQNTNKLAMKFYEKLGYNIKEKIFIEHYWKIK